MNEFEKYEKVFMEIFAIDQTKLSGLKYQGIETWDSVGHMSLMAALEDEFEIELDTDDIIDFSSFEKGCDILEKYGVDIRQE